LIEQIEQIRNSLSNFAPETLLIASFLGIIIIELILYKTTEIRQARESLYWLTLIVLGITFRWVLQQQDFEQEFLFNKMLLLDGLAMFMKGVVILSAIVMLLHGYLLKKPFAGEYFGALLDGNVGQFINNLFVY
jgi:NADH-quinone oxidoreductase subunit N